MKNINHYPNEYDIYQILLMYEDGIHSSPEAIINLLPQFERRFIYRIIFNYRTTLYDSNYYRSLNGLNKKKLMDLLKPIWIPARGEM